MPKPWNSLITMSLRSLGVSFVLALLLSARQFHGTSAFVGQIHSSRSISAHHIRRTQCGGLHHIGTSSNLASSAETITTATDYVNSQDVEFPWQFNGRAILCPMLVRTSNSLGDATSQEKLEKWNILPWSFFGWTVGGTVALEYDDSPVGPYTEFARLGCLASTLHRQEDTPSSGGGSQRVLVGQVGTKLYVNETIALTLCEQVWNMTAYLSNDEIVQEHRDTIAGVQAAEGSNQNRKADATVNALTIGTVQSIPLLWTPTITTIWAQLSPRIPSVTLLQGGYHSGLPLNRLRLSTTVKFVTSPEIRKSRSSDVIPLGFGVALCGLKIEISPRILD